MNPNPISLERVLILGAQGQVGRALVKQIGQKSLNTGSAQVIGATRREADLSNPASCLQFIEQVRPTAILNAAAYTQVDLAEKETQLAQTVNTEAPGLIAQWCAARGVPFVHFSTDYVFSGEGELPWKETDPIAPLNFYGKTKAEGEQRILAAGGPSLIFRTSWVYDRQGKNFLNTMLRLGKEREELKVVHDQFGAPTFAEDLARGAWESLQKAIQSSSFPSGIYHLCNSGETTWYEFAQQIFELSRGAGDSLKVSKLHPISSSEYPTPAKRPRNSRLNTTKTSAIFGLELPHWMESLKVCMQES